MKVLISGAGVAGLALAGFLKDTEIHCTLVEKSTTMQQSGFLLGLWSNGRTMLKKLGLGDAFDAAAKPFRRMTIRTGNGTLLHDYDLTPFYSEFGMGWMTISRADLHAWLLSAIGQTPLRLGTTIRTLQETVDGVHVVLSDGTKETYDLVVGAEGVHSAVRAHMGGIQERYTGWRVWWMWVDKTLGEPHSVTEFVEPGSLVALFNDGTRTLACLFARAEHAVFDTEEGRIERLQNIFAGDIAVSSAMFTNHVAHDAMPSDIALLSLKRWHTDRLVLVGDALHCFGPFGGLGSSMALEDAYVLAAELLKSPNDISGTLDAYESRRKPRVRRIARITNRMRAWGLVRSRILRKILDVIIPHANENLVLKDYFALMQENV